MEKLQNIGTGVFCPHCDNSGWLYLNRSREVESTFMRKGKPQERRYTVEGELAPCGWCHAGEKHHRRWPMMPWLYKSDEVDTNGKGPKASMADIKGKYMPEIRRALAQGFGERAKVMDEGFSPVSTPHQTIEEDEGHDLHSETTV